MYITLPQQARCEDRAKVTVGKNPNDYIAPALPSDASLISFHFFVNWENEPISVSKHVLLTRLIHFDKGESEKDVEKEVLRNLFIKETLSDFESVERACLPYGQKVRTIFLPEIPINRINDQTPVWLVERKGPDFEIVSRTVRALKKFIRRESGGPIRVGTKGLTYGTSAIECFLSKTESAYPGDVDTIVCDKNGNLFLMVEYKKHNLDRPISADLAGKYYPKKDGRKYQRLNALLNFYRGGSKSIPFVVLYYSTKSPSIHLQKIGGLTRDEILIEKDSGDVNISGWDNDRVASFVMDWVEKCK